MKKFVLHLATHLDLIQKDTSLDEMIKQERSREIVIFAREARQTGPFNNGSDVYVIGVTPRGHITNHGLHQHLYGYKYDSSGDPLQTLLDDTMVPEFSVDNPNVEPTCKEYGEENRVVCAVRQETPAGVITTMTGFHHAADDPIAQRPNCDDFNFTVTAKQLEDETDPGMKKELLKQFVQEVIDTTKKLITNTGLTLFQEGILPGSPGYNQHFAGRIYESAPCFQKEPDLRYGSIYAFIMDPIRGVAFLSGNDFTRNGLSVSLDDPNPVPYDGTNIEPNVLTAIHRTLTDTPPPDTPNLNDIGDGDSGFFTYHWAHPINTELNISDYLDRNEVPGRALKESYIEVVDIAQGQGNPAYFVFGSGIYLEEDDGMDDGTDDGTMAEDDDDGCSIAATGNAPQSTLLNLFLIASVLFSAVFLRKRV